MYKVRYQYNVISRFKSFNHEVGYVSLTNRVKMIFAV